MSKSYSNSYLYRKYPEYNKQIMEFIMGCERIDKNSKQFENVAFDIKRRQISNAISKVLMSDNVILGISPKPLPKAFKVIVVDDIKTDRKPRVFIDVSECIIMKDGEYTCGKIDWIISYLISAMCGYIYRMRENVITNNQSIMKDGAECFSKLFTYIVDRIYKISTVQSLRKRIEYISAMYYLINILGKDYSKQADSIRAIAMRIADIESRDAQIIDLQIDEGTFLDINNFVDTLNKIFKLKEFTVDLLVAKWMQAFGTGTTFALEIFTAFSTMLTDAYTGGYINQQMSIEKVTGQGMVKFTKSILQIGDSIQ